MSSATSSSGRRRVVILGGGFAGLVAAQGLRRADVDITLVDRRNFHLFQPLLYQVATGELSPSNIAAPLRGALRRQKNVRVLLAEATGFDVENRYVLLGDGGKLPYDILIVATGARHQYFGHDEWAQLAPGLKTVEDAAEIRRRVLVSFENAERSDDPAEIAAWQTFVIVGGGPTGVELAGALAELARNTLRGEFRSIDPRQTRLILVQGGERILPPFPEELAAKAAHSLSRRNVEIWTGARVTNVLPDRVVVRHGDREEEVPTHTVLWAAGVQASPLGAMLAKATGAEVDRAGRVVVGPDMSLPNHPDVFVAGDLASYSHQTGSPLPGVAQVAIQQGRYIAKLICHGRERQKKPFSYFDKGSLAVIGNGSAVAAIGKLKLSGLPAWFVWLAVHLLYLVTFGNRLLVFMQWTTNILTRNRSSLLITNYQPAEAGEINHPTTTTAPTSHHAQASVAEPAPEAGG